MQSKIAKRLAGLFMMFSLALAFMSFVNVYSQDADTHGSLQNAAEFEYKTFKNADCPFQQGDLRNLKHTSQKVRTSNDVLQYYFTEPARFSDFIFSAYLCSGHTGYNQKVKHIKPVPLFIRNRALLI